MSQKKSKEEELTQSKESSQRKRGPQSRDVSLSGVTFDEAIDIALRTKPKKKAEEDRDSGEDKRMEE